jgi:hypothetical protein
MKKLVVSLCAVFVTAALVRAEETKAPAPAEPAPAKEWTANVGVDYYTEYIFRGLEISSDNGLIMPHVVASYKGFMASYYGYYSDVPGTDWYTEHDYSLDYTKALGKLSVTAGALYYHYPTGESGIDTWDLYTVLAYDFPLLNPKITLNWDIDEFHGGYGTAGISHVFDIGQYLKLKEPMALTITPSAALGIDFGYNSRSTGSNVNWNDVLLGLSANFVLNETVSIHAGVQCSIALDSLNDLDQGNELIGNVGVAFAF